MSKQHPHLGGFMLLPPKPGTCQECATEHDPQQPHNQQSIYYQYNFYGREGRWPTWTDAMAHCTEAIKIHWVRELAALGVNLNIGGLNSAGKAKTNKKKKGTK